MEKAAGASCLWPEDGDRRSCRVDQWPWEDAEDQRARNHQDERRQTPLS
jgi:hypothetical protein